MAKKAHRPKEDISSLPKEWYNEVLNLYLQGGSDVEVKAMIYKWRGSFSNDLWERWIKEEPQFSETIKTGKLLANAWWMKQGRIRLKDREFNYTGWYMQMKNRYGWADRQQTDVTTDGEKITINWNEDKDKK